MSATNRNNNRLDNDTYATPKWCVDLIKKEINFRNVKSFFEPCRGEDHIWDLINVSDKRWAEINKGVDYFDTHISNVDLIITNPPFSLAKEFLQKSLREAKTVVYLLRLNFLGSIDRHLFWKNNRPTHLFVLSDRPSFVDICKPKIKNKQVVKNSCGASYSKEDNVKVCSCGNRVSSGTDATEYAWFVFDRGRFFKRPDGIYTIKK